MAFFLVGCGVVPEKNPNDTDFFMVSQGKVSALYSIFAGGVSYCKVTKHGIQHTDFTGAITYDGKTCKVDIEVTGD